MSRLGKQPIQIPQGVEVTFVDGVLTVKGTKGTLTRSFISDVAIVVADGSITLTPLRANDHANALWGTYTAHIVNMITGVTEGFEKKLEIEGVGYRAEMKGDTLVLLVGFSHPVEHPVPDGITVSVEKNVIIVSGADKEAVGHYAAVVRATKKPEPYKGKGIHYEGEYVIRKQGKKAVA